MFSCVDRVGLKMSRLDRFMVSNDMLECVLDLGCVALDHQWSNHCPLLLREDLVDYGPYPFRLFSSWMEIDEFNSVVRKPCIDFNGRMRYLKDVTVGSVFKIGFPETLKRHRSLKYEYT